MHRASTSQIRIVGVHHVQITIPTGQEEFARTFYCTLLGLSEITKPLSLRERGGIWLQVGERQLHIGAEDGIDRYALKAHLAYEVQGLEAWRRRLEEYGIAIVQSVPMPGYDRFEFRDPFGNRIEFIAPLQ